PARAGGHAAGCPLQDPRQGNAERLGPRPGRPARRRAGLRPAQAHEGPEAPARGARQDAAAGKARRGRRVRRQAVLRACQRHLWVDAGATVVVNAGRSYPAVEIRAAGGIAPGAVEDLVYLAVDDFSPLAITELESGDGWRVFFRTTADRSDALTALTTQHGGTLDASPIDV